MALVAEYGSSDDDDDSDEVPPVAARNNNLKASHSSPDCIVTASTEIPAALRLPAPTAAFDNAGEDALEDFVKRKTYGGGNNGTPSPLKSSLSLPAPRSKIGQGVKITAPALPTYDSDEDEPTTKRQKTTGPGLSGLLASLPAPKNISVKESGRSLLPHALTKPQQVVHHAGVPRSVPAGRQPSSAVEVLAPHALGSQKDDADRSFEEAGNFFSLDSPTEAAAAIGHHASASCSAAGWPQPESSHSLHVDHGHSSEPAEYGGDGTAPSGSSVEPQFSDVGASSTTMLADEQFLRLQGKKHRGKEEINIVDVCEDDFRASQLELTKSISQEVDPRSYSHRKKGEGPSAVEKRKHQITYLAFQAKERELELKNTWAANRLTKQQTQSKYGF